MLPEEPSNRLNAWILVNIASTGYLTHHSTSSSSSLFPGYFINKEDAQQEQMLLALKGTKSHVFHLEIPV